LMAEERVLVVNRDGYIVDIRTGEVVDEQPFDYGPEWRAFTPEERATRPRAAPLPGRYGRTGGSRRRRGRMLVTTVKLPRDLMDRLNSLALESGGSKSEIVRQALRAFLEGPEYAAKRGLLKELQVLYRLHAARGFVYAARYMLDLAVAYTGSGLLREDLARTREELETLLKHYDDAIGKLAKELGLWDE
ncbi:MAG TPA: ribbon-helix-helix protein, CopG family, partial [Pyrodictium sp.]|nr:ribbon-helix-helix protein, CopG family [Pyrodictium sp.]